MTEPQPPIDLEKIETAEEAEQAAAWLCDQLKRGIIAILDAEVKELADAFARLVNLPHNAGEARANNFLAALTHVSQARDFLRRTT